MGQERLAVPLIYNAIIQQSSAIIAQIKPYSCPDPNPLSREPSTQSKQCLTGNTNGRDFGCLDQRP
jgi:hypothetical protein